jgi:DNA polymerase-1
MPPLLVVDAPSVLFRAWFALPDSITDGNGRPVNAVLGATNILLGVVAEHAPRAVVLCFGPDAAPYRVELFRGYHAERPEVPEGLAGQWDTARELLRAFGWELADAEEVEADDLLLSYARTEEEAGGEALLLSGDRDLYGAVSERTTLLYLKTGVKGWEVVDAAEVRRRYGVDPAQVADFIALRGDPSDGLPGARGIGPKTAAELLARHGSLEGALQGALREARPRVRAALVEQADQLRAFREIATLQRVPVARPPDRATDLAAGAEVAARLGLARLAERLRGG